MKRWLAAGLLVLVLMAAAIVAGARPEHSASCIYDSYGNCWDAS